MLTMMFLASCTIAPRVQAPVDLDAPFSIDDRFPLLALPQKEKRPVPRAAWLEFYQDWVSSFDGNRCQLYPTCSGYAAECFRRHGVLWGFVLTSERLMHEAEKADPWRLKKVGRKWRYEDPAP